MEIGLVYAALQRILWYILWYIVAFITLLVRCQDNDIEKHGRTECITKLLVHMLHTNIAKAQAKTIQAYERYT